MGSRPGQGDRPSREAGTWRGPRRGLRRRTRRRRRSVAGAGAAWRAQAQHGGCRHGEGAGAGAGAGHRLLGDLPRSALPQACIRACKRDLAAETPVFPGNRNSEEQPLTENPRKYVTGHFRWDRSGRQNDSSGAGAGPQRAEEAAAAAGGDGDGDGAEPGPREGKRSYSMEHFRWGKPVGKKRRPVKVYPNVSEDQSAEAFPVEFKRERPDEELVGGSPEYGLGAEEAEAPLALKKDGGPYRMAHFRWGSLPKDKRYGGFMSSEKSQTPLVTLFKNAIIKNAHRKGQ